MDTTQIPGPARGATATGTKETFLTALCHSTRFVGDALLAFRVFLTTAFRVALLGEFA
jgi:hypothetical protein